MLAISHDAALHQRMADKIPHLLKSAVVAGSARMVQQVHRILKHKHYHLAPLCFNILK